MLLEVEIAGFMLLRLRSSVVRDHIVNSTQYAIAGFGIGGPWHGQILVSLLQPHCTIGISVDAESGPFRFWCPMQAADLYGGNQWTTIFRADCTTAKLPLTVIINELGM